MTAAVIQNSAGNPDKGSFIFDPDFPSADDRFLSLRPITRREAYHADITYGTNNEFGFDYLRDNMVQSMSQLSPARTALCHRRRGGQHPGRRSAHAADHLRRSARKLQLLCRVCRTGHAPCSPKQHYVVNEKEHVATLTEDGIAYIEQRLEA